MIVKIHKLNKELLSLLLDSICLRAPALYEYDGQGKTRGYFYQSKQNDVLGGYSYGFPTRRAIRRG